MIYPELYDTDPEVHAAIMEEIRRQQSKIELIASENFVSLPVLEAQGSPLTNKYAEGYPGKRYYGGCEFVDKVETLAIERAKAIFGAEHANVQPHSGAQANMCVQLAFLNPGDKILGMDLSHGGHLTHGMKINFSGRYFESYFYHVREEDSRIDYEELEKLASEIKPKMIIAGASAYPRIIDFSRFRKIADRCGAILMVDMAHIAGLVAAGLHPNPVPYADVVTTTTHKTLRGPRGGLILCKEKYAKNIDKAVFPGVQGGPLMHVIAAKAAALKEAQRPEFKEYQKQIIKNASSMASALIEGGLSLVSGGTDNHLMLIDLRGTGVSGKELQERLDSVNITANKNSIPFDKEKPGITSGLRVGTPAITTRGFKEKDAAEVADLIIRMVKDKNSADYVKNKVKELCESHPLYTDLLP